MLLACTPSHGSLIAMSPSNVNVQFDPCLSSEKENFILYSHFTALIATFAYFSCQIYSSYSRNPPLLVDNKPLKVGGRV